MTVSRKLGELMTSGPDGSCWVKISAAIDGDFSRIFQRNQGRDSLLSLKQVFAGLDGYVVLRPIGQGGMAELFLAERTSAAGTRQLVALK
jgi:hypothetical protein